MNFTPGQIQTGKTLVKWLRSQGLEKDKARLETAAILTRYEHRKIKNALTQSNCTSLKNLILHLEKKNEFKSSINPTL